MTNEKLVRLLAEAFEAEREQNVEYANTAEVLRLYSEIMSDDDILAREATDEFVASTLTPRQFAEAGWMMGRASLFLSELETLFENIAFLKGDE